MPKAYLDILKESDRDIKNADTLLQPIYAILIRQDQILCWTWGTEYLETRYEIDKVTNEVRLIDVPYNFDFRYSKKYKYDNYSIIKKNGKMVLLIKGSFRNDSIVFQKYIHDTVPIFNANLVVEQSRFINTFKLLDGKDSLLEKDVVIHPGGKVMNSKKIQSVKLTGGSFTLHVTQLNNIIPLDLSMLYEGIKNKTMFLDDLGRCTYCKVKLSNNKNSLNCILRFIDQEIYVYEAEGTDINDIKLKRFLFKLVIQE